MTDIVVKLPEPRRVAGNQHQDRVIGDVERPACGSSKHRQVRVVVLRVRTVGAGVLAHEPEPSQLPSGQRDGQVMAQHERQEAETQREAHDGEGPCVCGVAERARARVSNHLIRCRRTAEEDRHRRVISGWDHDVARSALPSPRAGSLQVDAPTLSLRRPLCHRAHRAHRACLGWSRFHGVQR